MPQNKELPFNLSNLPPLKIYCALAIAGFVISFIDLLLLLLIFGARLSLLGALGAASAAAS